MNLKPIETIYKGYRFRSRLEARWAVFFEEHGTEWQYETQGFELPSGRYLPDFYLPYWNMFVEIKPGPAPKVRTPSIYMAGRMTEPCFRPINTKVLERDGKASIIPGNIGEISINYTGPFRSEFDDHGEVHGITDGYNIGESENEVLQRSLDGVRNADVFFALFEDDKAFGTLVELGYARALGKPIFAGFPAQIICVDRGCCYPEGYNPRDRWNDLWFAAQAATKSVIGDRESVLKQFENWLQLHFSVPIEQKKARELSIQGECRVSVCYGDPLDAIDFDRQNMIDFVNGEFDYPAIVSWSREEVDEAAIAARQARFEFGQYGAPA